MEDIPDIVTVVVNALPQSGSNTSPPSQAEEWITTRSGHCTSGSDQEPNHHQDSSDSEESSDDENVDNEDFILTQEHIIGVHTANLCCYYADWINGLPVDVAVLPAATAISSPLNANNWKRLLAQHPNRPLVDFFINGINKGFLTYALQHLDTVEKYLAEEIAAGCVAGPFQKSSVPQAHISRFGVIPKIIDQIKLMEVNCGPLIPR